MLDEPLTAPSDFSCRGHYTFKPTHRPGYDRLGMMWHRLEDCPRDGPSRPEAEGPCIPCATSFDCQRHPNQVGGEA